MIEKGIPAGVKTGGDLRQELVCGNHRSVRKYKWEVLRKAMPDLAVGRAMVFKVKDAERI